MESPIGYPPPTLVRRRSGRARLVIALLALLLVAALIGAWGFGRLMRNPPARPAPKPVATAPVQPADMPAAALPDAAPAPVVTVEAPDAEGKAAQPSADGRKANQWYYVARLGDGPAAIYSRNGGQWNYAFACTPRTKTVEFIAVNTGSPGSFDKQSIVVGKVRLMMDASYSRDGGGTISTSLPAGHPFLKALDGTAPMEIQLYETRKAIVPVGPALIRLVRDCRGRG